MARGSSSTTATALASAARKKQQAAKAAADAQWGAFQQLDPQSGKIVPPQIIQTDPGRYLPVSVLEQLPQYKGFGQLAQTPSVETDPGRVLPAAVYRQLPQFKPATSDYGAFQPVKLTAPDIRNQDEHTFASNTALQAMEDYRKSGATPLVEDFKTVYNKALDQSVTSQQQAQQQLAELTKQTILQKQQSALELQRSQQLAQETENRTLREKAWEAAGKPVDAYGNPVSSTVQGAKPTTAMPDSAIDKAMGFINGMSALQQIGRSFTTMKDKTAAIGQGGIGGRVPFLRDVTAASSPEEIQFNADVDNNLVPIAKGVQGDTGATAGKDVIRASLHEALPNPMDDKKVGMGKVWATTQQVVNNLITLRDQYKGHADTSALDAAIEKNQKYLIDNATYRPASYPDPSGAVVQPGLSEEAQKTVDNVNNQVNTTANVVPPAPPTTPSPGTIAVQQGAEAGAKAGAVAAGATAGAQAGAQAGAAATGQQSSPNMQPLTAESVGNQPVDPNKFYLPGSD
jgi:hypothetical protein